ncbi:MAG: Wzt carbohydrate-binding domain-containing protein [Acidobacteriota bacterium]|nr:Wzt carbohydrate-binding domain-containing protein [Acidobacteriota bacterium]
MIEFPGFGLTAPDGSIIGIIEEGPEPMAARDPAANIQRVSPGNAIPDAPGDYILNHTLARADVLTKSKAVARLVALRRSGSAVALLSHDEPLLESCADEIWWLRGGALIARGDPGDVLARYRRHVAESLRASGENQTSPLSPTMRSGDGRAALESVELCGESGDPSTVFRSGEPIAVRVTVRFVETVADPVVGIMIRTRIGLNVYGTNTELEQLKIGPAEAGERLTITYLFDCNLCPGEYTVTAASHDPDGVWHDWMEDAVAFTVSDARFTAGVANLKARVKAGA